VKAPLRTSPTLHARCTLSLAATRLHGAAPSPRTNRSSSSAALQALGVGILLGACVTKVPQVLAVVRSHSVEGLSTLSLELELYCGLIHVCYGMFHKLAITAYGEAGVIWLQNIVLLVILYYIRRVSPARPALVVTVVALVVTPVALDQVSTQTMARLYDMNSTIYMLSKLPQISMAFRQVRRPLRARPRRARARTVMQVGACALTIMMRAARSPS
jgi:PQ loop repeat